MSRTWPTMAAAGLEVLDRKGGLINVILLDLMMPEMNGTASSARSPSARARFR